MGDGQISMEELAEILDEDILEYIQNGGELNDELMEYIQDAYKNRPDGVVADKERIPLYDVYQSCVVPSATQVVQSLLPLFLFCLIFRFICQVNALGPKDSRLVAKFVHMSSAIFGLLMLNSFFKTAIMYPVLCAVLSYVLLYLVFKTNHKFCGLAVAVFIVLFSISCELFFVDPKVWHSVRGAQIILSMKIISLGSDMASERIISPPEVSEYMGYCFNVGSVIFGPWISYDSYLKLLVQENTLSWQWAMQVCIKACVAGVCLIYSNCGTHWLILDNAWRWLLAYRDAQSFRFSHYFVSFVSDTTACLSGLSLTDSLCNGGVSRPLAVEVPRSLVEVVTNWNLPMHAWLKTHVFKPLHPHGAFMAVIVTYIASSLLHGLNFQLAAVLLSLGFYSYTEYVFRKRLSQIFDACIQARRCKEKCEHKYKEKHPVVMWVNGMFILLAVFHLAYLGLMFDSSDGQEKGYTMWHTLDKWSGLGYASHLVALGTFVFYWLI